ncbi:DgyrCDS2981 [Dimorphilus gyrociliatus]|uniref:Calcyclin-binding protein n=1 Tax=Dimorphilus gyrociliatus TaxID=2664684 RepID=A0A7I8VCE6_9ANNE|nr:DgyrCDS2981 [Dimorphilus gyrociliatus]
MASVEELKQDCLEIEKLLNSAVRPKVKELLANNLKTLRLQCVQLEQKLLKETKKSDDEPKKAKKRPVSQISTYGWDQSEKFMKIYVTVQGVHTLDKNNVSSQFTPNSTKMIVENLNDKDFSLSIVNLNKNIDETASYHKIKTDMVVLFLKKKEIGVTWPYVTQKDQEKSVPKMDESKDPGESMMSMLQNMYESGDDEMKRTIAKAWSESRDKKADMDI